MNTFKKVLNVSFAAVLLSMTSCVSDDFLAVTEPETQNEGKPITLTVTQGSPTTRLELGQDGLTTMWEPGDQLVLIDKARQRNAIYLNCTLTSPADKATFVSESGVPADDYWVIYNYNDNLAYRHHGFASIDDINVKDKLVLYGELNVTSNTSSATVTLQHLYAKMNIKLENIPADDNMGGTTNYTIGMYSSKKGFPLYRMFDQSNLVNAEYGVAPNNQNYTSTYFPSDRKEHNILFGNYRVEYSQTVDPQTGIITYSGPANLDQLEMNSALVLPEDLSGEDVFFYVLFGGGDVGKSFCYEIKKQNVKLEGGKSYTVVLDLKNAVKTEIKSFYDTDTYRQWYEISSTAEWRHVAYRNDGGSGCKLMNDINFSNNDYCFPISTPIIDGNGKKICNIYLDWEEDNVGLYRCPDYTFNMDGIPNPKYSGCTISNLTLENVTFKGKSYVGAFGGYNVSADNCRVTGSSVIYGTGDYVGGIVGWNKIEEGYRILSNVSIDKECTVDGANYVGGIVGAYEQVESYSLTFNSSQKPLDNCISSATVTASGDYVGGIFGKVGKGQNGSFSSIYFSTEDYSYSIMKCQNLGSVEGRNYVGGIGGEFAYFSNSNTDKETIVLGQSFSEGTVKGENYVGGILGSTWAHLNTCYSINTITATDCVGGIVGGIGVGPMAIPNVRIKNCYSIADLVVGADKKAGGIIGYGSKIGMIEPPMFAAVTVANSYFAGKNPQGSGIVGYSDGYCTVKNCLTTLASFGTNLGDHDIEGVNCPDDVDAISETGVNSILSNIEVINGEDAYSKNVWPSSQFGYECVKFAIFSAETDSPDYEHVIM